VPADNEGAVCIPTAPITKSFALVVVIERLAVALVPAVCVSPTSSKGDELAVSISFTPKATPAALKPTPDMVTVMVIEPLEGQMTYHVLRYLLEPKGMLSPPPLPCRQVHVKLGLEETLLTY
jgi:hypothetical protein